MVGCRKYGQSGYPNNNIVCVDKILKIKESLVKVQVKTASLKAILFSVCSQWSFHLPTINTY